jgi:hypothetical protein
MKLSFELFRQSEEMEDIPDSDVFIVNAAGSLCRGRILRNAPGSREAGFQESFCNWTQEVGGPPIVLGFLAKITNK